MDSTRSSSFLSLRSLFHRPRDNHFPAVDGLRALSVLWVVLFHCVWALGKFVPAAAFLAFARRPIFAGVAQGYLGVDVFFVISGFLIAYLLLQEHRRTGSLNVGRFYLRRVFRLLPAYFAALALFALLVGENLDMLWTNLLYVNNFVPIKSQCMGWAWSLAVEEQFYLVFPLFLLFFMRLESRWHVLLALLAFGFVVRGVVTWAYDLRPAFTFHPALDSEMYSRMFDTIYDKPYTLFGGLLVGVMVAYAVHFSAILRWLDIHAAVRRTLLLLSLGIITLMAVGPTFGGVPSAGWAGKAGLASGQYLFSLAVGYLILSTLTSSGKGSWLGRTLSARLWFPVAQLSYSAYLLHPLIIFGLYTYIPPPPELPASWWISAMAGALAATFLVSFIFYLFIERPFLGLRRRFDPQPERRSQTAPTLSS